MESDYGSFEAREAIHSLTAVSAVTDGEIKAGLLAIMDEPFSGDDLDDIAFMDDMEQRNVKREAASAFRAGARYGARLAWAKAQKEAGERGYVHSELVTDTEAH